MKDFFKTILICQFFFTFLSCSSDGAAQDFNVKNDNTTNAAHSRFIGIRINVESDLVRVISPGCYLVNVRVYLTTVAGQTTLVANQDVEVGDCGGSSERLGNQDETKNCQGGSLPNGDYVVPKDSVYEYCLLDLLLENEDVYRDYLISIRETVSKIK